MLISHASKYSHPKSWKNPSLQQQLETIEPSLNMQTDRCSCLLCKKDVSNIHDSSFSHRWKKITDIVRQCYVPNCLNNDTKMYCKCIGCINLPMQGLAPTQEQTSDTGSETSISSGEQLEHDVNKLVDEIFGNDEIDVHSVAVADDSF